MTDTRSTELLIVNADDYGYGVGETDAILAAHRAGAITSATAMVWMQDGLRAGELAASTTLNLGLHLNLIEPYSDPRVPPEVAAVQRRIVQRIRAAGPRAFLYHPGWAADFTRCIADQLAAFRTVYRREPTHVDGHQHWHLVPNALFSPALITVTRARRPVNRPRIHSTPAKEAVRTAQAALVRTRFTTTRRCLSIRALAPALGGTGLGEALSTARRGSVEIMVHPGWADEQAILLGPEWVETVESCRRGSYADLA